MVRLLIDKGASVNEINNEGVTALQISAGNGQMDCVELFMKSGADPKIRAKNGKTAMDLASENGHQEVAELLREAMGKR